jgi:hypothetical protein
MEYTHIEKLHPEYGMQPEVSYMNLPRPFIGGEVCTPDLNQSLSEVEVVATHQISGKKAVTTTDRFGEFRFNNLKPGYYSVEFFKEGYTRKLITNLLVKASINVEEVKLYPNR